MQHLRDTWRRIQLSLYYMCVDPAAKNNKAIREASQHGDVFLVDWLLQYPIVNPRDVQNLALHDACSYGHLVVVNRLFLDDRMFKNNHEDCLTAFSYACDYKYWNIAERIVQCPQLQSLAAPLYRACRCGNMSLINLILDDCRSRSADFTRCIDNALYSNNTHVVERIFQQPGVVKNIVQIEMIRNPLAGFETACYTGHIPIIDEFLRRSDFDTNYFGNGFDAACDVGNLDAVARLLQDPRINPSTAQNSALLIAWSGQRLAEYAESRQSVAYKSIIKLLLSDTRVLFSYGGTIDYRIKYARDAWYAERTNSFRTLHDEIVATHAQARAQSSSTIHRI